MASNPNPARITDQIWAVWEGFAAFEPGVRLAGIYAAKTGYHDTRRDNPPDNYSVVLDVDRLGPDDKAAAIDLTFPSAQGGNYTLIAQYSQRLLTAGQTLDPRAGYLREFFGQVDNDQTVEGWDYAHNRASTSDSSHLWHIHLSIHRAYVTDPEMTRAVLSILKGEPVDQWRDDMTPVEHDWLQDLAWEAGAALRDGVSPVPDRPDKPAHIKRMWIVDKLNELDGKIGALQQPTVDVDALVAALVQNKEFRALLVAAANEAEDS